MNADEAPLPNYRLLLADLRAALAALPEDHPAHAPLARALDGLIAWWGAALTLLLRGLAEEAGAAGGHGGPVSADRPDKPAT